MATAKRPQLKKAISPVGTASFPKLNAPDTKFKANGEYSTKLFFDPEQIEAAIEQIEAEKAAAFEAEKAQLEADVKAAAPKDKVKLQAKLRAMKMGDNSPYGEVYDNETGEPTGQMFMKFSSNARVIREGKPDLILKPDFFSASGKEIKVPPEIWGGSKLAIAYSLQPYNTPAAGFGMKLRLDAVQIHELSNGAKKGAAGYGFGQSEEGYEAPEDDGDGSPFAGSGDEASAGTPGKNDDF
ncbi:hypothetical protein GNX71_18450 [Variovorax sp. RKNM96]|uniref:hypothetical protein n=1 Tax=Variovorax sp. RKNM96 TaxID=2681552 RepID=UPI0019803E61|nr:hypothetical protein [Variovorax sp. RKNM96]QSI31451.1 hypothetical protein GNX71_18450 [Variovorax sp. RKNM96]